MAIVIKKKVPRSQMPALPADDAPKATIAEKPAMTLRTDEEALKDWKKSMPPPGAKPKTCAYCGRDYIKPCDEEKHTSCQNWQFQQSRTIRSSSKPSPSSAPSSPSA